MGKKILLLAILSAAITFTATGQTADSLTFSEIMFIPSESNSEFIEIVNFSTDQSVDLSLMTIEYYTSNPDGITGTGDSTILAPGQYAVIFEGDYNLTTGVYSGLVPEEALILKIDNNSFGSSGMSNSSDREVRLMDSSGTVVSNYTYTANNSAGISDEKILLSGDNSSVNWANSIITNGTPGAVNSVSPPMRDIGIGSFYYLPQNPVEGDLVEFEAAVRNYGIEEALFFDVSFYNDSNFNGLLEPDELLNSDSYSNLLPGDSITANSTIVSIQSGSYMIYCTVNMTGDENGGNDSALVSFSVSPPPALPGDMVVNEIMYSPANDEPEWIELLNISENNIDLNGWRIFDRSSNVVISDTSFIIEPGEYVVIADDASINSFYNIPSKLIVVNFPALNNTGDDVKISNSAGTTIDSVAYMPSWGGTGGKSLEKIDPDSPGNNPGNWGTSISLENGTPGYENSIKPKNYDLAITSFKSDVDYAVVGTAYKTIVVVKNKGLNTADNYSLKIFNDANFDSTGQNEELFFEIDKTGLNPLDSVLIPVSTDQFSAGINQYIAFVEFPGDQYLLNNESYLQFQAVELNEARGDLIINEIMYAPPSGQPEWIEIFNRSGKTINTRGYQIADASDTTRVVYSNISLSPGEFLIVAKDSAIFDFYSINSKIIISQFSSLNNSGDELFILDSLDRVIDSLEYFSSWGGTNGKSLERIDPDGGSTLHENWKSSNSLYGASPGFINSVSQKTYDISAESFFFDPPFPVSGDDVSISLKLKNTGKESTEFFIELFEDTNMDSASDLPLEISSEIFLNAGDSVIYNFNYHLANIRTPHAFIGKAVSAEDQDTTNNMVYSVIAAGVPPSTIVVNEIMFIPDNGEPEWVELFNRSDSPVNLKNWKISDMLSTPEESVISSNDAFIMGNSFLIISKDSGIVDYHRLIPSQIIISDFANLNNSEDGVIIMDDRGVTIDSVFYNSNFQVPSGQSLERKSVDIASNETLNWGASIDLEKSTPGRINSITSKNYDLLVSKIYTEPLYPVSGDGVKIAASIINAGSKTADDFSIKFSIETSAGVEILNTLSSSALSAGDTLRLNSGVSFTLLDTVKISVKIIFSSDEDTLNNVADRFVVPGFGHRTISINEVMYDPENTQPEWIEFVNTSGERINIKNWSVSDLLSSPTKNVITFDDSFIEAGGYFIVTNDSSLFNGGCSLFEMNFGSLGNSKDGVIIYDFRDAIIDSFKYTSQMGGRDGKSLERVTLDLDTNDPVNWTTSLDPSGSTPCLENSVLSVPGYSAGQLVLNEIMYEPDAGKSEFIEVYNLSDEYVELGGFRVFVDDDSYNVSDTSLIIPPDEYFTLAADSSIIYDFHQIGETRFKRITGGSSLNLTNAGKNLVLKDLHGTTIDSVQYDSRWHNRNIEITKNKSLERINPAVASNDPDNWSTCVNEAGATPGIRNSIFTSKLETKARISIHPNPFSPDNDGFEDVTFIDYNLTQATAQLRVKVFDSKGRLVRTLANNKPSGAEGTIIFDGLDHSGRPLRIGIYIIFIEALNSQNGVVDVLKEAVVVARKL